MRPSPRGWTGALCRPTVGRLLRQMKLGLRPFAILNGDGVADRVGRVLQLVDPALARVRAGRHVELVEPQPTGGVVPPIPGAKASQDEEPHDSAYYLRIAKQALRESKTIKAVVLEHGHVENGNLTAEQLDAALDVLSMTHP